MTTHGSGGDTSLPFRPGTISWDVLRRPVFLLGGMSALLLQIAEPRVAAGVAEHSDFANRIFDRLRHTVELMVEIGISEPDEADRALREMRLAHDGVSGSMSDGSVYDAGDPELRLWVLATLIATVIDVEQVYVGEFDEDDRRRYYQESLVVADVLEVGEAPRSLDDFRSYMSARVAQLQVGDAARTIAGHVLYPNLSWIPDPLLQPMRVVTADLLPKRLGTAYGLRLTPGQRKRLRRAQSLSRAWIPRIPHSIRTFPILRPIDGARERFSMAMPRPGWRPRGQG